MPTSHPSQYELIKNESLKLCGIIHIRFWFPYLLIWILDCTRFKLLFLYDKTSFLSFCFGAPLHASKRNSSFWRTILVHPSKYHAIGICRIKRSSFHRRNSCTCLYISCPYAVMTGQKLTENPGLLVSQYHSQFLYSFPIGRKFNATVLAFNVFSWPIHNIPAGSCITLKSLTASGNDLC